MSEKEIFPKSVDINPTSRCNLNCSMCWGPDHKIPDLLSTNNWKNTIKFFSEHGTDAIVFTGGEPLLRNDIYELIRYSKQLGMRVTLSTNTILLDMIYENIFPLIDELGIPMDASSDQKNLQMREGKTNSFNFQIKALSLAKNMFPKMEVTIRTVLSKRNIEDINNIGVFLKPYIKLFNRWKVYQFSPFSYGETNKIQHQITYQEFLDTCSKLKTTFPNYKIDTQSASFGEGRYVFVGSQGDIYGVGDNNTYLLVGNLLKESPNELTSKIAKIFEPEKNSAHAHI